MKILVTIPKGNVKDTFIPPEVANKIKKNYNIIIDLTSLFHIRLKL